MSPAAAVSDQQKQAWVKQCVDDPNFQAALVVETYVSVKTMQALAEQIAAQFSGGAAGKLMSMMGMGNGGTEKAG